MIWLRANVENKTIKKKATTNERKEDEKKAITITHINTNNNGWLRPEAGFLKQFGKMIRFENKNQKKKNRIKDAIQ